MSKRIQMEYFALFREAAGTQAEEVETVAETVADLYKELQLKHGFSLAPADLRASVNEEFTSFDAPLSNGDAVVFIPPVAGGSPCF